MGYVYSPFRMNDFMQGLLMEKHEDVELQVFDGDQPLKEALLYPSGNMDVISRSDHVHFAIYQSILEYAGRRWLLVFKSSPYFEETIDTGQVNSILLLGIISSLLLFAVVLSLTKSRNQALSLAKMTLDLEKANLGLRREIEERKQDEETLQRYAAELEKKNQELQGALAKVRQLTGLLPICASCKKIRDDTGYWSGVETYVSEHTDAVFSHGLCPECEKKALEDLAQLIRENK
ncbi:MAG: CHASE domain-containing protein [Proteobacteria bacterium]|nr:CHASE domain-containing protein [Pseudomonadota bacterium]MBU1687082.1 CHASE domain-containing protein [Pseudomonadota bacterium]